MSQPVARLVAAISFALGSALPAAAAASPARIRMSIDEDPIVLRLAQSLGYFKAEGVEIVPVDLERIAPQDYLMQEPLMKGRIDASYHWFNHTIYGARHGLPIKAVMLFNDAPGMTVMIANRVKDRIRGAGDFKGRNVAEGAGYGTKSAITEFLTKKAGLPPHSYTPVMLEKGGRQEAVIEGLRQGTVDVMTFQEPLTAALMATNMVTTLYDLSNKDSTTQVLGATFPAQSLLLSPKYIADHPEIVQRLVNALVRTMRFINSHSAEEIAAKLPPAYFSHRDRHAEIGFIRATLPTYAKCDYSFSPAAVQLAIDVNLSSSFDQSEEGRWRAGGDSSKVRASELYTNRFVNKAMNE